MDFHGMKRRDLQSLCKKHGIPANLKNSDMATRLASLFEKETEEIVTDTKRLPEEADGVKDNLVVKKVRFSPDNEVFEFTRSVKKRKQRNVRSRSQGTVQDLRQSGIKVRRSTRIASKGVTVAESSENESNTIREIVETNKSHKVARRSKRIGSSGSIQEEECRVLELTDLEQFEDTDISNELSGNNQDGFKFEKVRRQSTRLIAKRSKGLVEDELVKNNMKEVSMDFEVQETGKYHKKDVQDPSIENVCRRSRRFVSDIDEQTNAQVQQEEAGGAIVDAKSSSKKSKTMNQEYVKDRPEGMIDDSPSSSETKAAESVSKIENVLDSTLEKFAISSQRTNTQELNSELMEGEREEKLERDTVLMALIEEESEEVVSRSVHLIERGSPASVQVAATNPEAELVVPTGHTLVKDTASTVIAEETLTCIPYSELLQDNPLGMAEDSPSTETKAREPTMISENVTVNVSGDISLVRKAQECDSELVEREHVEKNEQETVLKAATTEKEEASMLSVSIIEGSEVKTSPNNRSAGEYLSEESTPPPSSIQLAMSNLEANLSIPSGHILVKDIVSTLRTELNGHGSVANLAKVEVTLQKSAEIHSNNDDGKGSLEKDLQAANSYGNFFNEHSIAEEEMEISKVGPCKNLTPQKLLNANTQLEPEEAWASNVEATGFSKKTKTINQEFEKEKPQGMAEDLPSTSKTKAIESVMIFENELDSTPKLSGNISLVRNKQESNFELMEEELEEKQEQDTALMAAAKDEEQLSSVSVFLIEQTEVSNPEAELSEETTPPPASVHLVVSNPEAELGVPTGQVVVKDIATTVVPEEDFKTKEEILVSISRPELKEHNFVAKLAETEGLDGEEMKAASNALDESAVFTIPDKNLMLMEQLSDGKISAAQSVTLHNDESVESHVVVFTTSEKVLLMGDFELDKADKEEVKTATKFSDECDLLNTTKKCIMLGDSRKNETRNERESIVGELHDESNIATSPVRQSSMEDLKEDGIAEESRAVVFTTPEKVLLLGDSELDEAEKEEDHTATEKYFMVGGSSKNEGESIVVELHDKSNSAQGDLKRDGIERNEENRTVVFPCDSSTCTSPDRQVLLGNLVSHGTEDTGGSQGINRVDMSGLLTSLEKQLLYGETEQKEAVKTREKASAEFHDESTVPNIRESSPFPEESELNEAAKSEENMAVALQVDYGIFTSAEKKLLLETDEEMKGDNITAKSHVVSDVIAASEGQSIMGDFKPENTDVELLSESNISTNLERHLLFGDWGTRKETICEESCVFTSPERRLLFGNSEPHIAGKQEHKEVEFKDESAFFTSFESRLLLGESGQDRFDIGKSDLSHHASSPKVVLKENVAALEFTETTSSDSNGRTASPAKDNSCEELRIEDISETKIGEISSHLEVAKTCSMVSGNNEADELIEAEVTKNNQTSFKENLLLDSFVSEKTFYVAGSEDEHFGFDSEVDEKSGHKSLADEATDPLATAVEEAISLTPGNITNEQVADETTPIPEETMNENPNTDGSGTLSEKQVRREPLLIYGTQVKPNGIDMKENEQNSKIVHNVNITAPRMTKRKPLQDLRNN